MIPENDDKNILSYGTAEKGPDYRWALFTWLCPASFVLLYLLGLGAAAGGISWLVGFCLFMCFICPIAGFAIASAGIRRQGAGSAALVLGALANVGVLILFVLMAASVLLRR